MRYVWLIILEVCIGRLNAQYNSIGYDSVAKKHNSAFVEANFENNKWSEGYIILGRGDTIYGKVKTGGDFYDPTDRQWQVEFQSAKTSETQYDPTQIRGYGYMFGGAYKSFQSMANTLPNIGGLYHDEERIFLEIVSTGRCTVYTFGQSSKKKQRQSIKRGGISVRPYCITRTGKDIILIVPNKFKKTMMMYFDDCPSLVKLIKEKKYTYQNWKDMVGAYNSECK
jgi:hypothetical protein